MMRKVSFQGTVWVKFVVFALLVFLGPTLFAFLCLHAFPSKARRDSLPPLAHGKAPTSIAELWRGYDPRKEKLDIELIKEWEQEGVGAEPTAALRRWRRARPWPGGRA
jgi:hypothetical protein